MSTSTLQEIALTQLEARKEYENKTTELQQQLSKRISAYNNVVYQTVNKFGSDSELVAHVLKQRIIPSKATLVDYHNYTNNYVFESNGQKQYIHAHLLRNDPIAVAMVTRHYIRKFQEKCHADRYKEAKNALNKANRDLKAAQTVAEKAQKAMDEAEAHSKKYEARILARLEKKTKAKSATQLSK